MKCPHCGEEISEKDIMPVIISSGEEFEQFLCDKINAQDGMKCEKTKASGDQGVDLVVRVADKKVAIQCKLYSDPVGNSAVQEVLAGRIMYKCDIGCVVTNAPFTISARELASATDIVLLNYIDVLSYLRSLVDDCSFDESVLAVQQSVDECRVVEMRMLQSLVACRTHESRKKLLELAFKLLEFTEDGSGYEPSSDSMRLFGEDCGKRCMGESVSVKKERFARLASGFYALSGEGAKAKRWWDEVGRIFTARMLSYSYRLPDKQRSTCLCDTSSQAKELLEWYVKK